MTMTDDTPTMTDAEAEQAKALLDKALAGVAPNIGIRFGFGLFREFRKRGWLTLEQATVLGILPLAAFKSGLPAYRGTHFAFSTWDIPDLEFQVGIEMPPG
jgi:hypothetical protein